MPYLVAKYEEVEADRQQPNETNAEGEKKRDGAEWVDGGGGHQDAAIIVAEITEK